MRVLRRFRARAASGHLRKIVLIHTTRLPSPAPHGFTGCSGSTLFASHPGKPASSESSQMLPKKILEHENQPLREKTDFLGVLSCFGS
jgi:hypothetical protein